MEINRVCQQTGRPELNFLFLYLLFITRLKRLQNSNAEYDLQITES